MKRKLILLFFLVVCIPVILSIIASSTLFNNKMDVILEKRATESLNVAGSVFEKFMDDISLRGRIISQIRDVQVAAAARDKIALIDKISVLRQDLNLDYYDAVIEIYDNSGNLMVAAPKTSEIMTDSEIISSALKGEFKNEVKFKNSKLKITSALPLYHESVSAASGVISISFFVSNKMADEIKKLSNTEVVIFSEDQLNPILGTTFIVNGERLSSLESYKKGEINLDNNYFMVRYMDKQAINGKFFLAVGIDKTSMLNIITSLQNILYIIGLLALIFALVLAAIFSKNLTNPINYLVKVAKDLGKGNLDVEVNLKTSDEFEILSDTLNKMRLDIKQHMETLELTNSKLELANSRLDKKVWDLSLMNQINHAIITETEVKLLPEILKIIAKEMNAQRSSIMLKDHQTNKLMLKFVYLQDEGKKIREYISFDEGEGIAGHVMKNGKGIICNDPENEEMFKKYDKEDMNEEIFNLLSIPLIDNIEVFGVINIVNKKGDFNEDDKNLIQDVANQVAIAIQNKELYEESITDGMTKLYIHNYFQARLEDEIKRTSRSDQKVSLIMFDIDHFKKFNDTYGHQIGDVVIKEVAKVIKNNVREGIDIPARYGGEEFAIIMPETDIEGAYLLAERLRKSIEDVDVPYKDKVLKVTISLGCSDFPAYSSSRQELISTADQALYKSKANGRNRTTRYNDIIE